MGGGVDLTGDPVYDVIYEGTNMTLKVSVKLLVRIFGVYTSQTCIRSMAHQKGLDRTATSLSKPFHLAIVIYVFFVYSVMFKFLCNVCICL